MSVAAEAKTQIQQIGGGFMFSREAKAFGATTGVDGFYGGYTKGRGGVLGDVDADVVVAAFGFFRPETIRNAWESVTMPAAAAAAGYAAACQDFGRRKLGDFAGTARLADLLESVVTAADAAGAPLFAGWRAVPLPADAPGRALPLIHTLRELRGGLHLMAVRASGLTPQQAVLIAGSPRNSGPDQARLFGWPEPFEEINLELRTRWNAAEALTDDLIAPAFATLDDTQGKELVQLLNDAQNIVFSQR